MLDCTSYKRNANQTHNNILLTPVRISILTIKQEINIGEDVKKKEPSFITCENVNYGKQYGGSSKNK